MLVTLTWVMLVTIALLTVFVLIILQAVDHTLSNYDAEGAWPYLIDEFVEYLYENSIIQKGQLDWSQKR